CGSDGDCPSNPCTRSWCENGLCGTEVGCPGDPCAGVHGLLETVTCAFDRHLGGSSCTGKDARVADRVNKTILWGLRNLGKLPHLCRKRRMQRNILRRVDRRLGELQILAGRKAGQGCYHELEGFGPA